MQGLDAGADDYLVKPFSSKELLARVRALLRRIHTDSQEATELVFSEMHIDFVRQTAERNGDSIALTPKEFAMLRLLADAAWKPVSRNDFLDRVWGYARSQPRARWTITWPVCAERSNWIRLNPGG